MPAIPVTIPRICTLLVCKIDDTNMYYLCTYKIQVSALRYQRKTPFPDKAFPQKLRSVRVPLLMFQLAKLHQKCRGCKFSNCKTDESSELNLFQRPSELMLPPNSSNKCNSSSWIFPRKFQSIIFVCLSFSAK